ncbi:hypothetical protein [Bradyrhizobium sp. CCBAU 53338]|uniref:hypothetical protein n=1 Tax=Bradyrhizobium sp. CCBAU 53338 TaxID=1325111 RepID=UPI00188B129B|nr:hypothetical protein [Bradyrhizobium sp. CCBAU 53338]
MSAGHSEWVVYRAPKSVSFGHQSRLRDPRRAWPSVQRFLAELTRSTFGHYIQLTCHEPGLLNLAGATSRVEEARGIFGAEAQQNGPYRTHPSWSLSEAQVPAAIDFALDDDKFPKQELGPCWFTFGYQFCWPEFDDALPAQTETRPIMSRLGLILGQQRLFLQPLFVYPGPWDAERVRDFIDRTEAIIPFRFRDQYFKRWLPPEKRGSQGRLLRLEPTWRRGKQLH